MTALTVKDIERARPAFGAVVVLDDGTEVVFAKAPGGRGPPGAPGGQSCGRCVFRTDIKTFGTYCQRVWCGASPNDGEYIPKMKYLELKLMGEVT